VTRVRLDEVLIKRGFYASRSRARDAVLRGTVRVDGTLAVKPAQNAAHDARIEIIDEAQKYVSRSALKLKHALEHFKIDVTGLNGLDIGASTGGFTQVLLEQGAAHVTAIDVGHGQFVAWLKSRDRVASIEGLNSRDLTAEHLGREIGIIVCDVSFISLKLALPAALDLVETGTHLIALIKPQFEAGREIVGRSGLVTDPLEHERVCNEISAFLNGENWKVLGLTPASLEGGDGNKEFLIAAVKN
jgi:23S rRNA (cytidine1920-2'-O)/16S rRNA (cytidine1409-2'-O)-methyltransferase